MNISGSIRPPIDWTMREEYLDHLFFSFFSFWEDEGSLRHVEELGSRDKKTSPA